MAGEEYRGGPIAVGGMIDVNYGGQQQDFAQADYSPLERERERRTQEEKARLDKQPEFKNVETKGGFRGFGPQRGDAVKKYGEGFYGAEDRTTNEFYNEDLNNKQYLKDNVGRDVSLAKQYDSVAAKIATKPEDYIGGENLLKAGNPEYYKGLDYEAAMDKLEEALSGVELRIKPLDLAQDAASSVHKQIVDDGRFKDGDGFFHFRKGLNEAAMREISNDNADILYNQSRQLQDQFTPEAWQDTVWNNVDMSFDKEQIRNEPSDGSGKSEFSKSRYEGERETNVATEVGGENIIYSPHTFSLDPKPLKVDVTMIQKATGGGYAHLKGDQKVVVTDIKKMAVGKSGGIQGFGKKDYQKRLDDDRFRNVKGEKVEVPADKRQFKEDWFVEGEMEVSGEKDQFGMKTIVKEKVLIPYSQIKQAMKIEYGEIDFGQAGGGDMPTASDKVNESPEDYIKNHQGTLD